MSAVFGDKELWCSAPAYVDTTYVNDINVFSDERDAVQDAKERVDKLRNYIVYKMVAVSIVKQPEPTVNPL